MSEPHDSILDPCASLEQEVHTLTQQVERLQGQRQILVEDAWAALNSIPQGEDWTEEQARLRVTLHTLNAVEGE